MSSKAIHYMYSCCSLTAYTCTIYTLFGLVVRVGSSVGNGVWLYQQCVLLLVGGLTGCKLTFLRQLGFWECESENRKMSQVTTTSTNTVCSEAQKEIHVHVCPGLPRTVLGCPRLSIFIYISRIYHLPHSLCREPSLIQKNITENI